MTCFVATKILLVPATAIDGLQTFSPFLGSEERLAQGTLTIPGPRQDPSLLARLWRHHLQDPYTGGIWLFTCADESTTMSFGVKD